MLLFSFRTRAQVPFSFSTFPLFDCILAPFVSTVNRRVLIFKKFSREKKPEKSSFSSISQRHESMEQSAIDGIILQNHLVIGGMKEGVGTLAADVRPRHPTVMEQFQNHIPQLGKGQCALLANW